MDDIAVTAARVVLAAVFLMAGWVKVREGSRFVRTVEQFRLLPKRTVAPFAMTLPWIEILIACALFAGFAINQAAITVLALMALFVTASVWAVSQGMNVHCDCFGLLYRERIGKTTLVRDALLILLALYILLADNGAYSLREATGGDLDSASIAVLAATVAAIAASAGVAYKASGGLPLPPTKQATVQPAAESPPPALH